MNVQELCTDESAVSPVISVILMVAITVILSAVVATSVLTIGGSLQENSPQANFEFDYNQSATTVNITHTSGDAIESSSLNISQSDGTGVNIVSSGTVTAGAEVANGTYNSGETIRVVWESENGQSSAVIGRSVAPA